MVSLFCVSAAFVVCKIMSIMYGTLVPVTYDKSVQVHTLLVPIVPKDRYSVHLRVASSKIKQATSTGVIRIDISIF